MHPPKNSITLNLVNLQSGANYHLYLLLDDNFILIFYKYLLKGFDISKMFKKSSPKKHEMKSTDFCIKDYKKVD